MLTLPIKSRWFDMIKSGEKGEEYRDATEYWRTRLETAFGREIHQAAEEQREAWIVLRNGYGADRPRLHARVTVRIGTGREEWGAEPGVEYFVLVIHATYDPATGTTRAGKWASVENFRNNPEDKSFLPPVPEPRLTWPEWREISKRFRAAEAAADPMAEIVMFIGRFLTDGDHVRNEVVECFTMGCCYWFAYILAARFGAQYGAEIVIDYTVGHFGTRIRGRVYDITGDVTEGHKWEPWAECPDPNQQQRIIEGCIMF